MTTLDTHGPQLQQASQARTIQIALQTALKRQVATLWPHLDPRNVPGTFPAWLEQMVALTTRFHGMSALAASVYYKDARLAATGEPITVDLASAPARAWLEGSFGYTGPGILQTGNIATALSTTQGAAVRIAASGGRQTILDTVHRDPAAHGWYRVTDGKPCAFCGLLAGRGVVYKREESADFQAHDDCGCSAAPAFSADVELPPISREASAIYDQHARGQADQMAAFRKAWAQRTS